MKKGITRSEQNNSNPWTIPGIDMPERKTAVLWKLYRDNKSLIIYIVTVYLDKALSFLLPMIVLYVSNDELAYNKVEYICSISNIIVPFLTFVSGYAFYGYRIADDRACFIDKYKKYSSISAMIICALTFAGCIAAKRFGVRGVESVELYVAIRTGFYLFVQYLNCYYRLIDRPIKAMMYSIFINIASAMTLFLFKMLGISYAIEAFFVPEILFFVIAVCLVIKSNTKLILSEYMNFILRSIRFAWPIVISSAAVAFVTNYGKVYAFNFLSSSAMYSFSFVMRLVTLIQMAHSAVISFFSKDIYINGYSRKFVFSYLFTVLCSVGGSFLALLLYNRFFAKQVIAIDSMVMLVFLYTLLHMLGTVFEVDYGRNNKNIYIFAFSLVACVVYIALVFGMGVASTTTLAAYLVAYIVVYDIAIITTWRKMIK